jgi:hypothetical protein
MSRGRNRVDVTGQRFTRLTVVSYAGPHPTYRFATWNVRCDCGKEFVTTGNSLRTGNTKSCGCLRGDAAGKSATPTYNSWRSAVSRCHNPKDIGYANYGGRGIAVCERWRESFVTFLADMGERPANTTLDREDNDGNYEPGNCRWADRKTQRANQREHRCRACKAREAAEARIAEIAPAPEIGHT